MNNIVEVYEDELRVSHRVIAENTDNKDKSIQDLITRNLKELEEFGQLRFKIATVKNTVGAVNEEKTYYLNEPQATLLITLMRNNETVKKFKINLVKEFYRMKDYLKNKKNELTQYEKVKLDKEISALKEKTDKELAILENKHKKEMEVLEYQSYKAKMDTLKFLQENFGYKVDIVALSKTDTFKNILPKELSEALSNTITEIRTQTPAYSATYLLRKLDIPILTKDFNIILEQEGIVETYLYTNSQDKLQRLKKFKEDINYYGYNKPSSSKNKIPYTVLFYEDRFEELLEVLKNKGHLDY
jgi:phage regulator Rha-like protein